MLNALSLTDLAKFILHYPLYGLLDRVYVLSVLQFYFKFIYYL